MWSLTRPTPARLDAVLAQVASLPTSYPEVGMSLDGGRAAYRLEQHRVELPLDFAEARERLASFRTHALPYMFVHPPGARVATGLDVVVCARIGGLWTINPCRIVHVDESVDRYRYAYGTLPGHSEHGEELFTVERIAGGVAAETIAWSRPQDLLARIGRPIAQRVQARVKRDYMLALGATLPGTR